MNQLYVIRHIGNVVAFVKQRSSSDVSIMNPVATENQCPLYVLSGFLEWPAFPIAIRETH